MAEYKRLVKITKEKMICLNKLLILYEQHLGNDHLDITPEIELEISQNLNIRYYTQIK